MYADTWLCPLANNAGPTGITLVTNLHRVMHLEGCCMDYILVVLSPGILCQDITLHWINSHRVQPLSCLLSFYPVCPVNLDFFFPRKCILFLFLQVQKKLPFRLQGPWRSVCSSEMWAAATSLRAELTATTQSVPNTPGPVTTGSGSSRYVHLTAVRSHRLFLCFATLWTVVFLRWGGRRWRTTTHLSGL